MSNQQQKPKRGRVIAAALAVTCACGAASLAAAEGGRVEAPKPQHVVVNQVRVNADGVRVYLDPTTGKIKQPTRDEIRALDQAIASLPSHELKNIQATQYSDGTVSVSLQGAYLNYALVRVNANGSLSQACVDDANSADTFLNGAAPAAEEQ
jgi:hypothetical protein